MGANGRMSTTVGSGDGIRVMAGPSDKMRAMVGISGGMMVHVTVDATGGTRVMAGLVKG